MEGADAALVGVGEIIADQLAVAAAVAVARHVDQNRDEAIEAVAPRQHAHARPLVELQHGEREVMQRVLVDLEQLVTRIVLQHVDQRLAGMAVEIEAGAVHHRFDLAAQIRDRAGRARIGGGGEQADDAELADQLAVGVEALHPHVIHVAAAMHARADRGFGDDQQCRLVEQRADLRRDLERRVPSLHRRHAARPHDAEPAREDGLQRVPAGAELVIADAQEGEIVGDQPFEELDRLGDLADRQRRRIGLELGDHLGDPRPHGAPVLHGGAHVAEHVGDRPHDLGAARLVVDALDVDVDEAFAQRAPGRGPGPLEGDELAGGVALDGEHRMHDQANVDAALGQLAQHRVDQERHVVVDDVENRGGPQPLVLGAHGGRFQPHLRGAGLALRQERPRVRRQVGELARVVAHEILGHRARQQRGDEALGRLAMPAVQHLAGRGDQRLRGALLVDAGKVGGLHGLVVLGAPNSRGRRDRSVSQRRGGVEGAARAPAGGYRAVSKRGSIGRFYDTQITQERALRLRPPCRCGVPRGRRARAPWRRPDRRSCRAHLHSAASSPRCAA